jgi:hypothetical protein
MTYSSTRAFRSLPVLFKKRDTLLAKVQKIEATISAAIADGAVAGNGGAKAATQEVNVSKVGKKAKVAAPVLLVKPTKRGPRGAVRKAILAELQKAGDPGISLKDLAEKIGNKPANLTVWFGTTGKKSGLVEALGKGVYRLKKSAAAEPVPAKTSQEQTVKGTPKIRRKGKAKAVKS